MARVLSTNDYDLNVYVLDGVVWATAYQMKWSDDQLNSAPVETNTEKGKTVKFSMDDSLEDGACRNAIAYLLEDENWNLAHGMPEEYWQEYDAWQSLDYLLEDTAPTALRAWANGLPSYTPEVVHDWEEVDFHGVDFGGHTVVCCKNCPENYTMKRMTREETASLK